MKFNYIISSMMGALLASCASVEKIPENSSNIAPNLSVNYDVVLNQSKNVKRGDILVEISVSPVTVARIAKDSIIPTSGSGNFKVSEDDSFFVAKSREYGEVYCGYKNVHRNQAKTFLQHGCLYDQDKDGNFESLLSRIGAPYQDAGRFLYYESEVTPLSSDKGNISIPYNIEKPDQDLTYIVGVKFTKTKKIDGKKHAVFDIVTKKRNEDQWVKFPNRLPIEIRLSENNESVNFVTPMFTAEISHPKNSFLEAKVISISDQSTFGFKRSPKTNNLRGYKPAYQVTGYR